MCPASRRSKACRSKSNAPHPGRLRVVVPPRISKELREIIVELLKLHKNASEVQRQLRAMGPPLGPMKVGLGQIIKVADFEHIDLRAGRPIGLRMPGVGGRPRGEGKKTSAHRADAERLASEGKKPSAIAAKLGITRQAVEQLIAPWRKAQAEAMAMKNGDKGIDG